MHGKTGGGAARLSVLFMLVVAACATGEPNVDEVSGQRASTVSSTPRGAGDGPSQPALLVSWQLQDAPGTTEVKSSVVARLKNTTAQPLTASVKIRCSGLDQRAVAAPLTTLTLAGNEAKTVSLAVSDIPLQGVDVSGALSLDVEASGAQLSGLTVPTTKPLYYHYRGDYSSAFFYGERERATTYHGGLVSGDGQNPSGRLKANGSWKDVAALRAADAVAVAGSAQNAPSTAGLAATVNPGVTLGSSRVTPMAVQPDGSVAPITPAATPDASPQGVHPDTACLGPSAQVCAYWTTQYIDSGYGEDYWTTTGQTTEPASYHSVAASDAAADPRADPLWIGYVDVNGCSTQICLVAGHTYKVDVTTQVHNGNATALVEYNYGTPNDTGSGSVPVTEESTFSVSANAPRILLPIHITSTTVSDYARVTAEAGMILNRLGSAVPSGTVTVLSNTGCGAEAPGVSCYEGNNLIVVGATSLTLANNEQKYDDSYWKFSFSHEFGHYIQDKTTGAFALDYDAGKTDQSATFLCTCDEVYDPNNQLHCMQSREYTAAASTEAYAHMISARTWNTTTQSDCAFSYYKEFYTKVSGAPGLWSYSRPPNRVDCTAKAKWLATECRNNAGVPDPSPSTHGVEYDWMNFHYNVTTAGSAAISLSELDSTYRAECNNGTPTSTLCNGQNISWTSLDTAAKNVFTNGSAKQMNFHNQGIAYGLPGI